MSNQDWIPRRFLVDNRGKPHDDSEVSLCTSCGVVVWNWNAHMRHLHKGLTRGADLGSGSGVHEDEDAPDPAQAADSTSAEEAPGSQGAPGLPVGGNPSGSQPLADLVSGASSVDYPTDEGYTETNPHDEGRNPSPGLPSEDVRIREAVHVGYLHGWRAARAHPDEDEPLVPVIEDMQTVTFDRSGDSAGGAE